jgi:hypothetical protein
MSGFWVAAGLAVAAITTLTLPLLRAAVRALPRRSAAANGQQGDPSLADWEIEGLVRERLYGESLSSNVSTSLKPRGR